MGGATVILKSDQEPAVLALVNDIIKYRAPAATQVEQSPVGSSGSNGIVERGIQSFQMMMRVMKDALETKWKVAIPDDHPILTWMTGYSSYLLNRFEVGRDGRTSYERLKGKNAKTVGLEFGEGLLFKIKEKNEGVGKLAVRWRDGVFLGVRGVSGEIIVGTREAVCRTRTVRRKPFETRWDPENSSMVGGVPWKTSLDDEGDGLPRNGVIKLEARTVDPELVEQVRGTPTVPRTFPITQKDLDEHGFTEGCAGCSAVLKGLQRQKHSEECRRRLAAEMKEATKVKDARKRESEFFEEVMEQDRAKKKRREATTVAEAPASSAAGVAADPEVALEDRGAKRGSSSATSSGGTRRRVGSHAEDDGEGKNIGLVGMPVNVEELDEELLEKAYDDVTGESLDPRAVAASRAEEIEFMETRGIWTVVPLDECWAKTGAAPTTVKWVDTKKRSRLVGRDFKPRGEHERADIFASMPPWEAKKLLFSKAASQKGCERKRKLLFVDATKAHVNGPCDTDAFIELPDEVRQTGMVAKLNFWLYGMRPAARAWEDLYADKLVDYGFEQGRSAPTVFKHAEKDMEMVVHGDDFTVLGFEEDLDELVNAMQGWFEIKVRGMIGPDAGDKKEMTILNRKVEWLNWGIQITADKRHMEKMVEHFGLDGKVSASVVSPGRRDESRGDEEDDASEINLEGKDISIFRGLAATMNYLSQDRFDTQFAAKELCREMAVPTQGSMARAKRAARYLIGCPTLEIEFVEQHLPKSLSIFVDSDWAGCLSTRKSTSGGVAMHGSHCVKTWASTQATLATSSAEAEFYAIVEGASRGLGMESLAFDLGCKLGVTLYSDASAGRSMAFRKGLGRVRHLETKYLWIQELIKDGRIKLLKVKGVNNPADVGTKHLSFNDMFHVLCKIGLRIMTRVIA